MLMESNPPKQKSSVASKKEPVLDEWEAKLLGKKGAVPYKSPESTLRNNQDQGDNISQFSQGDTNSIRSGFTGLPEPVPRNSLSAMQQPQVRASLQQSSVAGGILKLWTNS